MGSVHSTEDWFVAINTGNLELVKKYIAAGQDVNVSNGNGTRAIQLAVYAKNAPLLDLLMQAGATSDCLLNYHAVKNNKIEIVSILVKYTSLNDGLPTAVKMEYSEIVKILLEAGADPNSTEYDGEKVIFIANLEITRLLIHAGADTTVKNSRGAYTTNALCFS